MCPAIPLEDIFFIFRMAVISTHILSYTCKSLLFMVAVLKRYCLGKNSLNFIKRNKKLLLVS